MSDPELLLKGRIIIITGAGRGLGAAYAIAAARAGASIVVNDLDEDGAIDVVNEIRQEGGRAIAVPADGTNWDAARELVDACVTEFGQVDGLVNNAGIIGKIGSMLDTAPHSVEAALRLNVLGTIYPTVHVCRAMVDAGHGGAIVNVSSENQSGHAEFASYGASKGAMSSLTYGWTAELGGKGIRVNAISPNAFTRMTNDLEEQFGSNPEERDYPTAEDNAAVVVCLFSDRASALSGQIVRVDSGLVSITSHPFGVPPRAPIQYSAVNVAEVFQDALADRLQPLGISIAAVDHLEQLY